MAKTRIVNKLPQFVGRVQSDGVGAIHRALVLGTAEAAGMAPQHTSTLVNSKFHKVEVKGGRIEGVAGYAAEYALAVHEAPGTLDGRPRPKENSIAQGNFWDPRGEPEFLRKGFEQAEPAIRAAIKAAIKAR